MRALTLLLALALLGCGGGSGDDGGSLADIGVLDIPADAGGIADGAVEDVARDVAPSPDALTNPAPYTCMPCLRDDDCGFEAVCAEVDRMRAPGLRECRLPCDRVGERCDAPVAATCAAATLGRSVCAPAAFACIPMDSRRGAQCPAAGCVGRYALCADLRDPALSRGRGGFACVGPCRTDSDCEDGARRCVDLRDRAGRRVRGCVPDPRVGPEVCGAAAVNARGVGAPCGAAGQTCSAGAECLSGVDPAVQGFCTRTCASDADCGGNGVRCAPVPGRGSRCVPDDCRCLVAAQSSALDTALAANPASRWTRCNLYFTGSNLDAFGANVARDRYRLPVFDTVHRDWMAGARWARDMGPALDRGDRSLARALASAAGMRANGQASGLELPAPASGRGGDNPLADSAAEWVTYAGESPNREALRAAARSVPVELQRAMSSVLEAALMAARERDQGIARIGGAGERDRLFGMAPHLVLATTVAAQRPNFALPDDLAVVAGGFDLPVTGALRLAATVEGANFAAFRGRMGVNAQIETPAGTIVVRDAAPHRYDRVDYARTLLVVDLGGNDIYEAPIAANADATNPVSVLVDLAGDDRYEYPIVPSTLDTGELIASDADGRGRSGTATPSVSRVGRQGSGRLGVALLYDLGSGADRYRSLRMSQGFGAMGVGGLSDDGGNDEYLVEAGGQGSAIIGIGALVDGGGNDRYTAWAYSQGFGYVQGVGSLYDHSGDDVYEAKVTPVLYPSPQSPMSNSSFAQGAGFGRRGDVYPDRVNMSGGIGVLRDRAGADRYTCGVFGQGTGYWGGMGLLLDGAGDDRYDGRWYVQAGAAHFAYAALVDGGGRDDHNMTSVRQNMTGGAGHDFSLSVFLALGRESDTYRVPNLALGAGNANGAGIFAEEGGDDTYEAASVLTLGNAALETLTDPGRLMRPTAGIFLDGDGRDTYSRMMLGSIGNDRAWTQRIHPEAPEERGFGADGTGQRLGVE